MGDIGHGYGSEWHLLRFMGRHRKHLTARVLQSINAGTHVDWLDFNFNIKAPLHDAELKGFRFLKGSAYDKINESWRKFWPQSGNPPNWDGVGWLSDNRYPENPPELLLVEAKAHTGELPSSCGAKNSESKKRIEAALDEEIGKICDTYHSWRDGKEEYADVLGFCKSASLDEVRAHEYILTPGRYVGIEDAKADGEPFDEKMTRLTAELAELFAKSHKLEEEIKTRLGAIGYEF